MTVGKLIFELIWAGLTRRIRFSDLVVRNWGESPSTYKNIMIISHTLEEKEHENPMKDFVEETGGMSHRVFSPNGKLKTQRIVVLD